MKLNFHFDPYLLDSLVGGVPALEIPRLQIHSLDQAYDFIRAYGYDLKEEADSQKLWNYYRRAVTFIRTELMNPEEHFPEVLSDPNQLKDIAYLLIYASTQDQRENSLQRWACAILRVIHVLVHLDNDLFTVFSKEIQDQIFSPFQDNIYSDPVSGVSLGSPSDPDRVTLKKFNMKTFKTSDSAVTKLLAKREAVAFTLLDKMGVRFITKHLFDVFRVMRYLVNHNLVSVAHVISDQSNNTLFPTNILLEVMEQFTRNSSPRLEEIDQALEARLGSAGEAAVYRRKLNLFSSEKYQFIKFITRRLIRVDVGAEESKRTLSFFYPFEVQIVDYKSYLKNLSGPASHEKYKARQKKMARRRVLGL